MNYPAANTLEDQIPKEAKGLNNQTSNGFKQFNTPKGQATKYPMGSHYVK